ncbi:MAG: hypothetical protein QW292_12260 [Candidatus Parvarchaeota archaeon]
MNDVEILNVLSFRGVEQKLLTLIYAVVELENYRVNITGKEVCKLILKEMSKHSLEERN